MALMGSFLKGKSSTTASATEGAPITAEKLKQLIPIRNLDEDKLQTFAMDHHCEILAKGETLFNINEKSYSAVYLISGTVSLTDERGTQFEIEEGEAKSKFPLSSGIKHTTTAVAESEVSILRVSKKIMAAHSEKHHYSELKIPPELENNRLLQTFSEDILENELDVVSIPNIAIQLRKGMQHEIGIEKAVKRNGLNATRNLVISLSIRNIFKCDSPQIKTLLDHVWKNSIYLSSLSFVLAQASKQANPEKALLASLVADIGIIPFLNFVANLPADYYDEK